VNTIVRNTRVSSALGYIAAWAPLVLFYTLAIGQSREQSVASAVAAAARTVAFYAILGVGVVAVARRCEWPMRPKASLVAAHIALAFAYAGVWDLVVVLDVASGTHNLGQALRFVRPWIFWQTLISMLVYAAVLGLTLARRAGEWSREETARAEQADALRVRAELEALRGQLDPHFLFNTLHSVSVLVQHDPVAAQKALEQLATLLRYVLDSKRGAREDVPLEDELAFVDTYLALESIRFGDRLRVTRDISPATLGASVPSFTLQPLVENAIKHAIAPRAGGGTLGLTGRLEGTSLVLEVRDDGPGIRNDASSGGTGVGLDTLRRRLSARYGSRAALDISTGAGQGCVVTMRLPV
jgi:two-component system, LytTR family, sensor kinase